METTNCPVCGTSNSAKRQICHLCGQLLTESHEEALNVDANLQFINDEAKAATEAAIRDVARPARAPGSDAKSAGIEEKTARAAKRTKEKTQRERVILITSIIITVIALIFVVSQLTGIGRRRGTPQAPAAGTTTTTPLTSVTPSSAGVPKAIVIPPSTTATSSQQDVGSGQPSTGMQGNAANQGEASAASSLEQTAATGIRPYVDSVLSRVGSELGTSLSSGDGFSGSITQQNNDQIVALVSFSSGTASGSVSVLMQQREGEWQPAFFKDFTVTLTNPVVIDQGWENGGQQTYTGARVAAGGYEPLASASSAQIDYIVQ